MNYLVGRINRKSKPILTNIHTQINWQCLGSSTMLSFYMFYSSFYMFYGSFYMFYDNFYMFYGNFYMFYGNFYMFNGSFYMFYVNFYKNID